MAAMLYLLTEGTTVNTTSQRSRTISAYLPDYRLCSLDTLWLSNICETLSVLDTRVSGKSKDQSRFKNWVQMQFWDRFTPRPKSFWSRNLVACVKCELSASSFGSFGLISDKARAKSLFFGDFTTTRLMRVTDWLFIHVIIAFTTTQTLPSTSATCTEYPANLRQFSHKMICMMWEIVRGSAEFKRGSEQQKEVLIS